MTKPKVCWTKSKSGGWHTLEDGNVLICMVEQARCMDLSRVRKVHLCFLLPRFRRSSQDSAVEIAFIPGKGLFPSSTSLHNGIQRAAGNNYNSGRLKVHIRSPEVSCFLGKGGRGEWGRGVCRGHGDRLTLKLELVLTSCAHDSGWTLRVFEQLLYHFGLLFHHFQEDILFGLLKLCLFRFDFYCFVLFFVDLYGGASVRVVVFSWHLPAWYPDFR